MKFRLQKSSLTVLALILLPFLLGVLGCLQYVWLSEISTAERERLQARLEADVRRFAQDFNGEITKAYFTFQFDSEALQKNSSEPFAERFGLWQSQAKFPQIVGELYLARRDKENNLILQRFDASRREFEPAECTGELAALRDERQLGQPSSPGGTATRRSIFPAAAIAENVPALIVPIFENTKALSRESSVANVKIPSFVSGDFVIVKFDLEAIKAQFLPELSKRYFLNQTGADFNVSIAARNAPDKAIYQSQGSQPVNSSAADAATGIFDLSPETSNILILNSNQPRFRMSGEQAIIFHQKLERQNVVRKAPAPPVAGAGGRRDVQVQVLSRGREKTETIFERRSAGEPAGRWLLTVRHADGSLENFVNRTRRRNLAVSFGILALLGASVVLLAASAHRAKRAAQKQIDFVSSVSHEFRTPVAVICSAGDNLADGIVKTPEQVEKYGKLVRREGRRIAEMVEQILEFAGARRAHPKYDFRPVEIGSLIETVLADSESILEEKGFTIEKQIARDLPPVSADAGALRTSLQNLVNNSIKYSNGSRWLGVSAKTETIGAGKQISISIRDKGIGIDAREQKQIFEPFYRGREAVARQIRGNGLGLSLVKQTIEAHNGKIRVESKPGEGSRFTIEIPVKSESLKTFVSIHGSRFTR